MPLDTRIPLGVQAPQLDLAAAMEKGMSMRRMNMQNQAMEREEGDRMAMGEALKRYSKVDKNGRMSVDSGAAMSALSGKIDPQRQMAFQKQLDDMDTDTLRRVSEQAKQFAWSVTPENYAQKRQEAIENGMMNAEKLPEFYSPQSIERMQLATLEGEKQLQYRMHKEGQTLTVANMREARAAKEAEALAKREEKLNGGVEGLKALDKDYAKDYNDFTSNGIANARASIEKLKAIKAELEKDKGSMIESGGGRMSSMPEWMRSRDSIRWRDQAQGAANATLKSIFGGQLSDSERKSAAAEFYNDSLGNAENVEIMAGKIAAMEEGLQNQMAKANHFGQHGTLRGFSDTTALGSMSKKESGASGGWGPGDQAGSPPKKFKTDQIDWAD